MGEIDIENLHKIYRFATDYYKLAELPFQFREDAGSFETVLSINDSGKYHSYVDKNDLMERHFTGVLVTGTDVITQKYYSPYSQTEIDYKPNPGKEILCYLTASRSGGGQFASVTFRIWGNATKDSKIGGRDIFGTDFTTSNGLGTIPPFILKENEYLNIERTGGSATGVIVTKIVGVKQDAT